MDLYISLFIGRVTSYEWFDFTIRGRYVVAKSA